MSLEDNKAVVRRFYEGYSRGDEAIIAQVVDRAVKAVFLEPSHPRGFDELVAYGKGFRGGFPDANITVDEIVAEGDLVAVRGTCSGTHRGEFEGIPPTGKRINILYQAMLLIVGGKIVGLWEVDDMLTLMQQVGALPSEAAA